MHLAPDSPLDAHIASFWIYERARGASVLPPVYEFPSLSPELVLGLRGAIRFVHGGQRHEVRASTLFGHLGGPMVLDLSGVDRMIVVRFAARGVASALPFARLGADALVRYPYAPAAAAFGRGIAELERHLAQRETCAPETLAADLSAWFLRRLDRSRLGLLGDIAPVLDAAQTARALAQVAGCSASTLARRFRRETGLTPKRFLARNRFRRVLAEVFASGSDDWLDYVVRYGFYDQSHFIKEMRRFSGFTPRHLLTLPVLASHR